ncbi:LysR family transcriptional regulator [Ligilactobacillus sp. LYQ135]
MNIKDLKYFNALIESKNFSLVAQKFSVSQPTITMAIKRLEQEFNTKFFIRDQSHKELLITEAGHQFYAHSSQIIKELEIANKEIQHANLHKITFGLPPIIGTYYFPKATPALLRHNLLNKLNIISRGSKFCHQMLLNGDLDLALLGTLNQIKHPGIVAELFGTSSFKIIVSKTHPWAHKKMVSLSELKNQPFIIQNESYIHNQALTKIAQMGHFHPNVIVQTDNINILKALVSENVGIGLLADIAIVPTEQLHSISINATEFPTFNMSIVYRTNHVLTPNQKELLSILRTSI